MAESLVAPSPPLPYHPGWINRLMVWVDRLPFPYWLFYAGLAGAIVLAQHTIKWNDGTLPKGNIDLPLVLFASVGVYALGLMHHLNRRIPSAMQTLRPIYTGDEATFQRLVYQLSTAAALPVFVATLAGMASGYALQTWLMHPVLPLFKLSTTPISTVFDGTLLVLTWGVLGAGVYGLIDFLQTIAYAYKHTDVNLFQPQPLYSLSGLASRAAIGIAFYNLPWITLTPGASQVPAIVALTFGFQLLALATFVWPLLGVHTQLLEDKHRRQQQSGKKLQFVLQQIHHKIETGDGSGLDTLQKQLGLLQIEQTTLDKAPTWPWHPETIRVVITAIAIPMAVWLAQRGLERFGLK